MPSLPGAAFADDQAIEADLGGKCAHRVVVAPRSRCKVPVSQVRPRPSTATRVRSHSTPSLRFSLATSQVIGIQARSVATDCHQPQLSRSVGFGPVPSPPKGALCWEPSIATSDRSSSTMRHTSRSFHRPVRRRRRLRAAHRGGGVASVVSDPWAEPARNLPRTARHRGGTGSPRNSTDQGSGAGDSQGDGHHGVRVAAAGPAATAPDPRTGRRPGATSTRPAGGTRGRPELRDAAEHPRCRARQQRRP